MDKRNTQALSNIRFDPGTGELRWPDGRLATGRPMPIGYLRICAGGRAYYAHRVAWLLVTGQWPCGQIDHANGDRSDNRWASLRIASPTENNANSRRPKNNTTGFKGVTCFRGKYRAQIAERRKRVWLGDFETAEAAALAYAAAARRAFGPFARAS